MDLNCPLDGATLDVGQEHGIEVDRCAACGGAWYEYEELEMLESTIANDDERRGMIDYAKRASPHRCPACQEPMHAFNYRAYNLEIEACGEGHGFWMDKGESDRIREVMRERVQGLTRAGSAEKAWHRAKSGGGGGVLDSLKGLFRK